MGRNDIVEFSVAYLRHTDKAIHIKDGQLETWIPLSLMEDNTDERFLDSLREGDIIDISIPEWLAEEKGLW